MNPTTNTEAGVVADVAAIAGPTEMMVRDVAKMRAAGGALAIAAVQVIHEYDGLHRLSLAVAEWQKVIASEGDRDIRYAPVRQHLEQGATAS